MRRVRVGSHCDFRIHTLIGTAPYHLVVHGAYMPIFEENNQSFLIFRH